MEFFTKLSTAILVSIVKEFGRLTYSELQKNQRFFEFLKEHNLVKPKDDFENLYLFSLIRFSEKVSNRLFLEVFKHKDAFLAFIKDQRENSNSYGRALNNILLTDPEISKNPDLKKISQIPENDILCFEEIYKRLCIEVKTPSQLEESKKIELISEGINDIKNKINFELIEKCQTSELSIEEILNCFNSASADLDEYLNTFGTTIHIERDETKQLYNWILSDLERDKPPIGILAGNAGYGKSVIISDLYKKLKAANIPVLGIKADRLTIKNLKELKDELQINDNIESIFNKIAQSSSRFVFLVDQIDALSQSLSSDRSPINTYHRIISNLSSIPNIRIIISCRLYDLDYDPILQQYRNKQIFKTSSLSVSQVEEVLNKLNLNKNVPLKLIEFLRVPLHLQIFCKINHTESFGDNTTLQNLYDALWDEYIITKPNQNSLSSENVIKCIEKLSDKMYDEQQIVVDVRLFIDRYKREIEYLNTNEIINKNLKNKIQFVHQSFFDYSIARLFVQKGEKITSKLSNQHQGLFLRSVVKQVLDYSREVEPKQSIKEVEEILFGNFRFHIKLLIINSLGFYQNPTIEEKQFVKTKLFKNWDFSKLFIEAANSAEWFRFLTKEIGLNKYLLKKEDDVINSIYQLCIKAFEKCPFDVIDFLRKIPDEFESKNSFICRSLISVDENNVSLAFDLFHQTKNQCDEFCYYHFLEKAIKNYPDFVISELRIKLLEFTPEKDSIFLKAYIPGSHDSSRVYSRLFEVHPDLSIDFFIEVIEILIERSKMFYEEGCCRKFINDWTFFHYVPFKDNHHDFHYQLTDIIIKYFTEKIEKDGIQEVKPKILPLLKSDLISILNICLRFLIQYPHSFIIEIFELLSKPNFLIEYSYYNQLFTYQIRELIKTAYSFFTPEQKQFINDLIIKAIPVYEKSIKGIYKAKGVSEYGYTNFGSSQYDLLSMIPLNEREKFPEIGQKYKELSRKFGENKNSPPQGVVVTSGVTIMAQKAYENMSNKDWKKSFRKYVGQKTWDGVSEIGHNRKFEELVSLDPEKFKPLIEEIIEDESIPFSYVVYGLQGLSKGNYKPIDARDLFIRSLKCRKYKIEREYLQYLVWLTEYFINNNAINDEIINFLVDLAINYPDSESWNDDIITDGINSVRGAAFERLVRCYIYREYEEVIFSTLERIALNSAAHTRASALLHLAVLLNLDRERTIKLFIALNHDFHPKLISIGLHDGNPLRYLFNSREEYLKLIPFLSKAIEFEEAHKVLAHVLFWAWLGNFENSEKLLNSVLEASVKAKMKAVEVAFGHLDYPEFFEKSLAILNRFLSIENKELGDTYERQFHRLSTSHFNNLYVFLSEYSRSEVGKYREYNFYQYLLKAAKDEPEKCIDLAFNFKAHVKPDIQKHILRNEPLQVVIQAYNAIRDYKNTSEYLEIAMDVFDEMLKVREYRGTALDVLHKLDA